MIDLAEMRTAIAAHGRIARVVLASLQGHAPREVGAAMLVWADGQLGTIGGGALEYGAAQVAREALVAGAGSRIDTVALGPNIGQCCGGSVTLVTEVFSVVPDIQGIYARPMTGRDAMPMAVARLLAAVRRDGALPPAQMLQGWFIEPVSLPQREVWIWGAGHVGRALVQVLAPLSDVAITWVDTAVERFPDTVPVGVRMLPAPDIAAAMTLAPTGAEHVILTYSHALDLALCDAALRRGFSRCGVIGSATKWARFRARLAALGHRDAEIARIECPIGDPSLGKHPQAIAIGVAARMMARVHHNAKQEKHG